MTALPDRMTPGPPQNADTGDAGRAMLAALLLRIVRQDGQALQHLYGLTSAKLNGVILAVVRDHVLAEEVLQDTYMNVWRQASSYDSRLGSPITWLVTIARNRAIDRLRSERSRTKRFEPLDDIDVADETTPVLDRMMAGQDAAHLRSCLGHLDADQQRAIRAAFFDGLTYEELARRENVPLSTMKSRIRRGLIRLRACMDRT